MKVVPRLRVIGRHCWWQQLLIARKPFCDRTGGEIDGYICGPNYLSDVVTITQPIAVLSKISVSGR